MDAIYASGGGGGGGGGADNSLCMTWYGCAARKSPFFSAARYMLQACHIFFVKKPKIFENVKSERAEANFQKSLTPRVSTIISKNSQI